MKYIVTINQTEYEVEVEKGTATLVNTSTVTAVSPVPAPAPTAIIAPTAPVAPAPPAVAAAAPAASAPATSAEGTIVKSPMPGTILDIRVQPGTSVKRGGVLLILEAMKMENEIVSPVDGIVGQIYVTKGASIATNEIMISIL